MDDDFDFSLDAPAVAKVLETHKLEQDVHDHAPKRNPTIGGKVWEICKCGAYRVKGEENWTPGNYPSNGALISAAITAKREGREPPQIELRQTPAPFAGCEHRNKTERDGIVVCKDCGASRPTNQWAWDPPEHQ